MKLFSALALVCVVVTSGCVSGYRDEYGRLIPKRPKWTLQSENPDPERLLMYDRVYVYEHIRLPDPELNISGWRYYEIVRFWPSGRMMSKYMPSIERDVFDSFEDAGIGYYKITNEEMLLQEWFVPINFGQYGYSKSYIDKDGSIVEFSAGPSLRDQRNEYDPPRRFVPMDFGILTLQPDW